MAEGKGECSQFTVFIADDFLPVRQAGSQRIRKDIPEPRASAPFNVAKASF
jgi:hypothetical protein